MKITYDKKADAMYIYKSFSKKKVTKTEEISSGWIVDYSGKELVGIEILNASKVLGSKFGIKSSSRNVTSAVAHRIR